MSKLSRNGAEDNLCALEPRVNELERLRGTATDTCTIGFPARLATDARGCSPRGTVETTDKLAIACDLETGQLRRGIHGCHSVDKSKQDGF